LFHQIIKEIKKCKERSCYIEN